MLDQALANWQQWGFTQQPQLMQTFTSGKSHHTGLIEADGQKWVLKVFNHSFEQAMEAQQFAVGLGIAPKLAFQGNQVAVMEYIDGGQPSITQLAQALGNLHSTTHDSQNSLDLLSFCETYLQHATEHTRNQHQRLLPILNEFVFDSTAHCFCHNDLVVENCLSQGQQAMIIDWEYAAHHNPWFDLAAVVLYQELSLEQAKGFLRDYKQWQHKTEDRIFIVSQVALLWGDLLWHVAHFGNQYSQTHQHRFLQLQRLVEQLG